MTRFSNNTINSFRMDRKQIIRLIIVFFGSFLMFLFGWRIISDTESFQFIEEHYNRFTVKVVQSIGSLSNKSIDYDYDLKVLTFGNKMSKLIMPVFAYRLLAAGFILLALVPFKKWKTSLSAIIFVMLFLSLRGALITYISLFYKNNIHEVLLVWLDPVIYVAFLVLGIYIIRNNALLSKILNYFEFEFSKSLTTSLSTLFFLLIIVPPIPRVLFTYLHSEIMPSIVSFILFFSKQFLAIVGKTAEVSGRFIHLENNWIDLEYPCIGLGVFTLIATLVLATRGRLKVKLIYLSVFAFIFLILNALRLSLLLLYINSTYQEIGLNKVELHNNATYFMYVVAFAGFLVYWFGVNRKNSSVSK